MRQSSGIIFFGFFFYALGICPARAQPWTNGQAASYVIGQPGFGVNAAAVTATGLNQPAQAIIDPTTGKVFVCAPDGSSTYSQIVTITVSGSTGLSIYPNPAQRSVVVIVAQAGGVMAGTAAGGVTAGGAVAGAAVNHIDISRLAAGVYTVRVLEGGYAMSGSFVKMN